jgi:hypothetical protein
MSGIDLSEIRAQLRAESEARPSPRGPLGALKKLLGQAEPQSLFTAPPAYEPAPKPRAAPASPVLDEPGAEEEPLLLDPRRDAFGLRGDPSPPPPPEPLGPIMLTAIDSEDVGEALERLRSALVARHSPVVEHVETPFHDEDLMDESGAEATRLYKDMLPEPAAPSPGEVLLNSLAERLIDEQVALISRIATRGL